MRKHLFSVAVAASLMMPLSPAVKAGPHPPLSIENTMRNPGRSALQAVRYRKVKQCDYWCHVVDVDLNCPDVEVENVRAEDTGHTYLTFGSMVRHHRPLAAITGTFFDTVNGQIIGNVVRGGRLLNAGYIGNTIAIDGGGKAEYRTTQGLQGYDVDWSRANFAISAGPTLVHKGRISLNPSSEGFRDPGLFRMAARAGIGITPDNHMLMVTVNRGISLARFAQVMKGLGACDALNMDGGSSTAIYCRGQYPSHPGRRLTNLIMVKVRPGDPIPREVQLEAQDVSDQAPTNVDDFTGLPPRPNPVELNTLDF